MLEWRLHRVGMYFYPVGAWAHQGADLAFGFIEGNNDLAMDAAARYKRLEAQGLNHIPNNMLEHLKERVPYFQDRGPIITLSKKKTAQEAVSDALKAIREKWNWETQSWDGPFPSLD